MIMRVVFERDKIFENSPKDFEAFTHKKQLRQRYLFNLLYLLRWNERIGNFYDCNINFYDIYAKTRP